MNTKDADKPPPLRSVLTRPVLFSVANYAMVVLLEMICLALFPPNWSTTVEFGGLGLSPASIGSWMSTWGCMDGIFQFAVIPRVVDRFGLQRVFITCVASCAVVVIMFPLENLVLRQAVGDSTTVVRPLIFLQLLSFSILSMGYCESLSVFPRRLSTAESTPRSSRCDVDVRLFCGAQQAGIRHRQRFRADSGLDRVHIRAGIRGFAVCVFHFEGYFGRELCICRIARTGVGRTVPRRAASKTYVVTRRGGLGYRSAERLGGEAP